MDFTSLNQTRNCTCEVSLLTPKSFLLSGPTIVFAFLLVLAVIFIIRRIRHILKPQTPPLVQYERRMVKLFIEIKALLEIGTSTPIVETYDNKWKTRDHILWAIQTIDEMDENGRNRGPVREDLLTELIIVEKDSVVWGTRNSSGEIVEVCPPYHAI